MSNNFVKIAVRKTIKKDAFEAFTYLLKGAQNRFLFENYFEEFNESGFVSFSSEKGSDGLTYWVNLNLEESEEILLPISEELGRESIVVEIAVTLLASVLGDNISIETTAVDMFPKAVDIVDEMFEVSGVERSPTAPEWSIAPHIGRRALVRPTAPELELL